MHDGKKRWSIIKTKLTGIFFFFLCWWWGWLLVCGWMDIYFFLVGEVIIRKHIAQVGLIWFFCITTTNDDDDDDDDDNRPPKYPSPARSNRNPKKTKNTRDSKEGDVFFFSFFFFFQDSYRLILGVNWRVERWFLIPSWYHRAIPLLSKPLISSLTLIKSEWVGIANKPISTCRKDASSGWTKSESKSTQPCNFLRSVKNSSPTFKSELLVVDEMLERRWVAQCMAVLGVSSVRRMECKPELNDKLNGWTILKNSHTKQKASQTTKKKKIKPKKKFFTIPVVSGFQVILQRLIVVSWWQLRLTTWLFLNHANGGYEQLML